MIQKAILRLSIDTLVYFYLASDACSVANIGFDT